MSERAGFTLIELMVVIVIIGILAALGIPNYMNMVAYSKEADVMSSAHTVQLAAETYAIDHSGQYSDQAGDLTPQLPRGLLLRNPFTDEVTEPQFGAEATTPGQIGIQVYMDGGSAVGYTITGFGKDQQIICYSGNH